MKKVSLPEVLQNYREVCEDLRRPASDRAFFAHELCKYTREQVIGEHAFHNFPTLVKCAAWKMPTQPPVVLEEPKILLWDIETKPLLGWVWSIWEQNVALNQIHTDWSLLSFAAKWLGEKEVIYRDLRNHKDIDDDRPLLEELWKLLDEADIVITQNGKAFDSKKTNARFILNGMPPPSPYAHIDTKQLAKKHFAFTSNKLEYLSDKLCKTKKLKHKKFPGFELWKGCMSGDIEAWKEMEDYNKADVLALEELYLKLRPWGSGVSLAPYKPNAEFLCQHCGSGDLTKQGSKKRASGAVHHQYRCKSCGGWTTEKGVANNLLSDRKKAALKGPI